MVSIWTKYCPHCGSVKIHKVEKKKVCQYDKVKGEFKYKESHYHECEECNETWEHHDNGSRI